MDTDATHNQLHGNKKSPVQRGNYSHCGKLCDQTFYLSGLLNHKSTSVHEIYQTKHIVPTKKLTYAFSSVSRQKKPNLRMSSVNSTGQFSYKPNYLLLKSSSPEYSIPKSSFEKTQQDEEIKVCYKHPLARRKNEQMINPEQEEIEKIQGMKNIEKLSTKPTVLKSQQSFEEKNLNLMKKSSLYLTKQEIMIAQRKLKEKQSVQKKQTGYVQFYKKKSRYPNNPQKKSETFLPQHNFNNFYLNKHPNKKDFFVNFRKRPSRKSFSTSNSGPNTIKYKVDFTKVNQSNYHLNIEKLGQLRKSRYQRLEPMPSTRLDYDTPVLKEDKMVGFDKMQKRNSEIFSNSSSNVQKRGDNEIKKIYKQHASKFEVNGALWKQ